MCECPIFFPLSAGTVSVIYLVILVTLKTARLGFHLEFNWVKEDPYFVPGKLLACVCVFQISLNSCMFPFNNFNRNVVNDFKSVLLKDFLFLETTNRLMVQSADFSFESNMWNTSDWSLILSFV